MADAGSSGTGEEAARAGSARPGLQVIGAGFGRTGTYSLQAALDILFTPQQCLHFGTLMLDLEVADRWAGVLLGEVDPPDVNWKTMVGPQYAATMDHPFCDHWRELLECNPDARVILSEHPRGEEGWYRSKLGHQLIYDVAERWPVKPLAQNVFPVVYAIFIRFLLMHRGGYVSGKRVLAIGLAIERRLWGPQGLLDREHVLSIKRDHDKKVMEQVPAHKLLVFRVTDGWGPLCAFLDKPIPDVPFPKEQQHSTDSIKKFLDRAERLVWCVYAVAVAVIVALGHRFYSSTQ